MEIHERNVCRLMLKFPVYCWTGKSVMHIYFTPLVMFYNFDVQCLLAVDTFPG